VIADRELREGDAFFAWSAGFQHGVFAGQFIVPWWKPALQLPRDRQWEE